MITLFLIGMDLTSKLSKFNQTVFIHNRQQESVIKGNEHLTKYYESSKNALSNGTHSNMIIFYFHSYYNWENYVLILLVQFNGLFDVKNGNSLLHFLCHIFKPRLYFYLILPSMTLWKIALATVPNMILLHFFAGPDCGT